MKEMLGYQVDEEAAALMIPPRTIKVLNFGEVKVKNTTGRPINSVSCTRNSRFCEERAHTTVNSVPFSFLTRMTRLPI